MTKTREWLAHRLEELALTSVASAHGSACPRLGQPGGEDSPCACVLLTGGPGPLSALLRARGVWSYRQVAEGLWALCEEVAEGRLDLGRCTLDDLAEAGVDAAAARRFLSGRLALLAVPVPAAHHALWGDVRPFSPLRRWS